MVEGFTSIFAISANNKLWVLLRDVFNILFDNCFQCPLSGRRFSSGTLVSSGNNTDLNNIQMYLKCSLMILWSLDWLIISFFYVSDIIQTTKRVRRYQRRNRNP